MADSQYDVSPQFKKLFDLKQQQRKASKEYFQKLIYSPYRPGTDPVPFDPLVTRFGALMSYSTDYFRPNAKNLFGSFCLVYLPIFLTYKWYSSYKRKHEALYKSGQVAYKDRPYKLVM